MTKQRTLFFRLTLLVVLTSMFFGTQTLAAEGIFSKLYSGLSVAAERAYGEPSETLYANDPFLDGLIRIINILLTFAGIVFFLLMIYAGYLWLNARGNEETIAKAKKMLREALIGFIVIILARLFTEFILTQIAAAIA